jgi:hypothetical protein
MAVPTSISSFSSPMYGGSRSPNRKPYNPRYGASVTEIMSQREGNTGAYDQFGQQVPKGTQLFSQGWNSSGVGPGTRGYRGSGTIGSAAGAIGSTGIPTSQRGRAEKYGMDPMTGQGAWQLPSWMVGQQQRDQFGMSPAGQISGMGSLPFNSASPMGSNSGPAKPADSSTSTKPDPWAGRTTFGDQPQPQATNPFGNGSMFGGGLGIPSSFFGTSVYDMLNRSKLWQ